MTILEGILQLYSIIVKCAEATRGIQARFTVSPWLADSSDIKRPQLQI